MPKRLSSVCWFLLIVILAAGLYIGKDIHKQFKERNAKIAEQEQIMKDLMLRNSSLQVYSDSLDKVIIGLHHQQDSLSLERNKLQGRLHLAQVELRKALARLANAWEPGDVLHELDQAFPTWQGQFREAMRGDGIHGIIAPQFFGMQVVELKIASLANAKIIKMKDSTITNLEQVINLKNAEITAWTQKSDSLKNTYDHLWQEYNVVDEKYNKCLKSKWCTIHIGMSNILAAGVGFAGGYAIRGMTGD
jgi:hypothetical protein